MGLDRKARAAAAGGHGIGVLDLERLADQVVDEIDLGTAHELETHGIDQHDRLAFGQNRIVAARLFLYEIVFILESGTATASHRNAQHGAFGFFGQDARHALGGAIGQNDFGRSKGSCGHDSSTP